MSMKPIVLRQHIRGSDSAPLETILNLSLGEEETACTIKLNEEQLQIVEGDDTLGDGSAVIHTQHGFVCVESLRTNMWVQSIASGFDGKSANGTMLLQVSDIGRRIYYQLHPGESVFIGSSTISIVPEEHRNIPASPSGYESYKESVSQLISQYRSPSLRPFATPVHHRVSSNFSSPTMLRTVTKQTDTTTNSRESAADLAKPNLLGIVRGISKRPSAESLNLYGKDPSLTDNPFVSDPDLTAKTRPEDVNISFDARCRDGTSGPTNPWQKHREDLKEQREKLDQDVPTSSTSHMKAPNEGEDHHAFDMEETIDEMERSDPMSSAGIGKPYLSQGKRLKLLSLVQDSAEEEETQNSMKSNIVVEEPQLKHKIPVQQAMFGTRLFLQDLAEAPDTEAAHDQGSIEKSSPVLEASEDSEQAAESARKASRKTPTTPKTTIKILLASSTSTSVSRSLIRSLGKQGVQEASNVTRCTALCVAKHMELKKTSKLIMAVLQGKPIITDDWVTHSASAGKLLDMEDFKAKDQATEAEWGIVLDDAIKRNRHSTPKPFDGWAIVFTPAAKKDAGAEAFRDLKEIALYAGAKNVFATLPRGPQEEIESKLIIACHNDPASALLRGRGRCFSRDIIGLSSLRGKLDIDSDEFLVSSNSQPQKSGVKRKKQK